MTGPRNSPTPVPPLLAQTAPVFRWRHGNHFELLTNGDVFFPRMLSAIEQARESIWLELYLVEPGTVAGQFIDALERAAARGLEILLILDALGSRKLSHAWIQRLCSCGIQVRWYNPQKFYYSLLGFLRDHRKLMICDGQMAFVGGTGLTDDFSPTLKHEHWRETMLAIQGPVIRDWESLFLSVWNNRQPSLRLLPPLRAVHAGSMSGRVTASQATLPTLIQSNLLRQIRRAEERVWIATPYFLPSLKSRRALKQAARRGVDVRLLVPGPKTDHPWVRRISRAFYQRLLHNGVAIYEYQPRFLHMKVMLCDDWASVGSSNMDRWGLFWNLEANQEIRHLVFSQQVAAMLEADFAHSHKMEAGRWQNRSQWSRLLETLWHRVAHYGMQLLERLRTSRFHKRR